MIQRTSAPQPPAGFSTRSFVFSGAILLYAGLVLMWGGCTFDSSQLEARTCAGDTECVSFGENYRCIQGYCMETEVETCTSDSQCSDDSFCNGNEICNPGGEGATAFGCAAGAPPNVDDGIDCTEDICDEAADEIKHTTGNCECARENNNLPCETLAFTMGLICVQPICNDKLECEFLAAPPGENCGDDGFTCSVQPTCNNMGECVETAQDSMCNDNLMCNGVETCNPDAPNRDPVTGCVPGEAVPFDDGIACTSDSCDEAMGVINDPAACECQNPGTPCQLDVDQCRVINCSLEFTCEETIIAGQPCDDGVHCTDTDLCNDAGECVGVPTATLCSDMLFCTTDLCDPFSFNSDENGCIHPVKVPPDDGVECTVDLCDNDTESFVYQPVNCAACSGDAECVPDQANPCLRYFCDNEQCVTEPVEQGSTCDDGFNCTQNDVCDGTGQCTGTLSDETCGDPIACNGVEICQPEHPDANEQGCRSLDPPNVDDNNPCTLDTCQECNPAQDPACVPGEDFTVVNTPGAECGCQNDEDCPAELCEVGVCNEAFACEIQPAQPGASCDDGIACTENSTCNAAGQCGNGDATNCECENNGDCIPGPCEQFGSCVEGACVFEPEDAGTTCALSQCDTASTCDGAGTCVRVNNDALCSDICTAAPPSCSPENPQADPGTGCVSTQAPNNTACDAMCGDTAAPGTCQQGVCTVTADREGPTGSPSCNDGQDNDCDGLVDAADSDCATPTAVEITAVTPSPVSGLGGAGASLEVVARDQNGDPVTLQTENLYCTGRQIAYEQTFDDPATINNIENQSELTPLETGEGTFAASVTSGVTFSGDNTAVGMTICNGHGLEIGPFALPNPAETPKRSLGISIDMANPTTQGLGDGAFMVVSYKTNASNDKFLPLVALGGSSTFDNDLEAYEFLTHNANNYTNITVRIDLVTDDMFRNRSCGFVDAVRLFNTTLSDPAQSTGKTFLPWTYGGTTEDSTQTFLSSFNAQLNGFFAESFPAETSLSLSSDAAITGVQRGVEWSFSAGNLGVLPPPPILTYPNDLHRSDMLVFDFAGQTRDTSTFSQWTQLISAQVPIDFENPMNIRKLASLAPNTNLPDHLISHYDVTPGAVARFTRFQVVLPEDFKPLLNRTLAFTKATTQGSVYLDEFLLYSFTEPSVEDIQLEVQAPTPGQTQVHPAVVRSARTGKVRVQCYWQQPGNPDTETIASEPINLEFQ